MTETEKEHRVLKLTRRQWVILASTLGLCAFLLMTQGRSEPAHNGHPVSIWFAELCAGSNRKHDTARVRAAAEAFSEMGTNVIPFLENEILARPAPVLEGILQKARELPVLDRVAGNLILPSSRRFYAAVAMRRMGRKAISAVPALIQVWQSDPDGMVRDYAGMAVAAALTGRDIYAVDDWKQNEAAVLAETRARFPQFFPRKRGEARNFGRAQAGQGATE